jgi:hypothetical protein
VASESESDLMAEGIIPIAKQAVIGKWQFLILNKISSQSS